MATPVSRRPKSKARTPRIRRAPHVLLPVLKAERDQLTAKYEQKLAKLNDRITRIETKHAMHLQLTEMAAQDTTELQQQLDQAKHNARLLRQALKRKAKA